MSNEIPNALTQYLDEIETSKKRTGVGATIEIIAYAKHASIKSEGRESFQLNGEEDLIRAVRHLYARLAGEAKA